MTRPQWYPRTSIESKPAQDQSSPAIVSAQNSAQNSSGKQPKKRFGFRPIKKELFMKVSKNSKNMLECPYCPFEAPQSSSINGHVNTMHELNQWYRCDICDMTFLNASNLKFHLKTAHQQEIGQGYGIWIKYKVTDPEEIDFLRTKYVEDKSSTFQEPMDRNLQAVESAPKSLPVQVETSQKMPETREEKVSAQNEGPQKQLEPKMSHTVRESPKSPTKGVKNSGSLVIANRADFKERIHTKDTEGITIHICPYCDFSSKFDPSVTRHIDQQHEGMLWYKCPLSHCGQVFHYSESKVNKHKASHENFPSNEDLKAMISRGEIPELPIFPSGKVDCRVRDEAEIDRLRAEFFIPKNTSAPSREADPAASNNIKVIQIAQNMIQQSLEKPVVNPEPDKTALDSSSIPQPVENVRCGR